MTAQHPAAPETEQVACICPTDDYCPKCHPRWHAKWIAEGCRCATSAGGHPCGVCVAAGSDTPAAPETETDANGLTEAERQVLMAVAGVRFPEVSRAVERIVAERVRVVEGERDAAREALDNYLSDPPLPIGNDVIADAQETAAHALEANRMNLCEIERLTEQLAAANESAESAEAAHEAEKAAHERLRADRLRRLEALAGAPNESELRWMLGEWLTEIEATTDSQPSANPLAVAAAWVADSIGYPVEVKMPDRPMPQALWEALVDHVHADASGKWHGNTLDCEETESWLADEAGRALLGGGGAR